MSLAWRSANRPLRGGAPGSEVSDMTELISITNLSASPLDFHFFQYADFDLSAADSVQFTNLNSVQQSGANTRLTETVVTPIPSHRQGDFFPTILNSLNDAAPTTLNDTPPIGVTIGAGDKFFAARPSPDGRRVAFLGLTTGVHVVDLATMRVTHLGAGTAPTWSPDGRFLVFERTEDDGHDIVASDLWLYEPGRRGLARLTATDEVLERRPSFSPDGRSLAFDDDRGAILLADLEVTP